MTVATRAGEKAPAESLKSPSTSPVYVTRSKRRKNVELQSFLHAFCAADQ
jgi:hypothetical protein